MHSMNHPRPPSNMTNVCFYHVFMYLFVLVFVWCIKNYKLLIFLYFHFLGMSIAHLYNVICICNVLVPPKPSTDMCCHRAHADCSNYVFSFVNFIDICVICICIKVNILCKSKMNVYNSHFCICKVQVRARLSTDMCCHRTSVGFVKFCIYVNCNLYLYNSQFCICIIANFVFV